MFHLLSPINLILLKENALFFAFVLGEFCYSNYKICRNIVFHITSVEFNNNNNILSMNTITNSRISNKINTNHHIDLITIINYNAYPCEFMMVIAFIRNISINNLNIVNNILNNITYNKNNIIDVVKRKVNYRNNKIQKMRSHIPLIARWLYPLIELKPQTYNNYKIENNFNNFNNHITSIKISNNTYDNIQQNYNIIHKRFGIPLISQSKVSYIY